MVSDRGDGARAIARLLRLRQRAQAGAIAPLQRELDVARQRVSLAEFGGARTLGGIGARLPTRSDSDAYRHVWLPPHLALDRDRIARLHRKLEALRAEAAREEARIHLYEQSAMTRARCAARKRANAQFEALCSVQMMRGHMGD